MKTLFALLAFLFFDCGLCAPYKNNDDTKETQKFPVDGYDAKLNLFEGDIMLTEKQRKVIEMAKKTGKSLEDAGPTFALTNVYPPWTDGVVIYDYDRSITNVHKRAILAAMNEWTTGTDGCITFRKRTNERNYLEFFVNNGCWGHIGMPNGKSQISVGRGCEYQHVMTHEIGHVLGFWHEQSRTDRDQYLQILWQNVPTQFREAFAKYGKDKVDSLGVPYDYTSIMHYPWNAFSTTGRDTVKPLRAVPHPGPYKRLSPLDIKQAKLFYKCDGVKPNPTTKKPDEVVPTKCTTKWVNVPVSRNNNPNCRDSHRNCASWAKSGECSRNPRYMMTSCCRSCKGGSDCQDKNRNCKSWASRGECRRNPGYMNPNCPQSCNKCGTTKKKVTTCVTVQPPTPPVTKPTTTTLMPPIPTESTAAPTTTEVPPVPTGDPSTQKPPPADCDKGGKAVGIETSNPDIKLSASSSESKWHDVDFARLNRQPSDNDVGAWCAAISSQDQFLQVDLANVSVVKRIDMQGRAGDYEKYVKKFTLSYSDDGKSWTDYVDAATFTTTKEFEGNADGTSVKSIVFDIPVMGRYIRFHPTQWQWQICMRVEVYRCE